MKICNKAKVYTGGNQQTQKQSYPNPIVILNFHPPR